MLDSQYLRTLSARRCESIVTFAVCVNRLSFFFLTNLNNKVDPRKDDESCGGQAHVASFANLSISEVRDKKLV